MCRTQWSNYFQYHIALNYIINKLFFLKLTFHSYNECPKILSNKNLLLTLEDLEEYLSFINLLFIFLKNIL